MTNAMSEQTHPPRTRAATGARRLRGWAVRQRPYFVVLVASTFIVSTWFRTGTFIATGDMGPFIRRGWAPEAIWSWNHSVSGGGSAAYNVARGAEFMLISFWQRLGFDEYVAQWSWYTIIYGLVAFGTAYVARAFVTSEIGVVVAGLFAVLNGFFLTRLPNPLNIISVGVIALITGIAIRVAQGRRVPPAIAGFALMPTAFLGFNPPMLVVAYAWTLVGTVVLVLLALGRGAAGRLLWWFVKAAPWAVLLNVWWLVPLAQGFTGGGGATANADFTDPTNWSWSQINNTVPNILTLVANWAWFRPQYLPWAEQLDQPWWIWIRYLIPALVLLAPVVAVRRNRRVALVLLGLSSVFVFLAKGLMPPLEQLNLWLYLHAPGFWLFREPMSKLGQLLVIFFAVLLAMLVEGLVDKARERGTVLDRFSLAGGLVAVALVLAYPFPLYNGTVIPDERPQQPSAHVRVPAYWWDLARSIDADTRPGKVLVLPLDDYYQMPTTWGFFGVDSIANLLIQHPVISPKPDGYFSDSAGFQANTRAVEAALVSGDLSAVPRLLDAIGASRVVVRHDLVRGIPGRTFADDQVLAAALAKVPGMSRQIDGTLELWYAGDGSSATVRTYDRLLAAPGRVDAVAAAVGTLDTDTAVRAAPLPTPERGVTLDNSPASSDDVVAWPVPAVDSGSPSTTVEVTGGDYTLAQRSRAAPTVVPSIDRATSTLVLTDPTRVLVDGEVRSSRPPLRVPIPTSDVVAVTAGTRTVSLDGWGRESYPRPPGADPWPATFPLGSATELTLWAPSPVPARPTAYSDVYDCNNYEPRPAAELALSATVTGRGSSQVARLSARDHAACTRVVIRDAAPGRTYRVRMEYRTVEGKRPQICLFQPGSDGCSLTARPVLSDRWAPFEAFVTVDDVATGLQVVLQANVGQRLLGTTTVEYRGLTVDALDAVATTTVFPPEVAQTPLTLTAGTHTISVEGGPAGSILEDFEPLQDCFRYDDQTPEQAGLIAQPLPDEPGPAFRLGARAHMACIGATAPAMGDVAMYELSFDGRSVVLRNPKVCLYLRGPDRCQSLPPTVWNGEWQTYALHVAPDPGAAETRLYLYGLRDLNGKRSSQVDYRAVRLRPVASTSTVVLVRRSPATSSADVTWSRENPTRYPVTTTGAPTTVVLRESYAPGWQLQPTASSGEHIAVQGWANAWLVPADGSGTVVYAPARIARYALLSLPIAVVLALVSMVLGRWWYRRRQRRKQEAADRLGAASVPADPGASPDDSDSDEEVIP